MTGEELGHNLGVVSRCSMGNNCYLAMERGYVGKDSTWREVVLVSNLIFPPPSHLHVRSDSPGKAKATLYSSKHKPVARALLGLASRVLGVGRSGRVAVQQWVGRVEQGWNPLDGR